MHSIRISRGTVCVYCLPYTYCIIYYTEVFGGILQGQCQEILTLFPSSTPSGSLVNNKKNSIIFAEVFDTTQSISESDFLNVSVNSWSQTLHIR